MTPFSLLGAPITDGVRIYVSLDPTFDYEKQRKNEGVQGVAAIGKAEDGAANAPAR